MYDLLFAYCQSILDLVKRACSDCVGLCNNFYIIIKQVFANLVFGILRRLHTNRKYVLTIPYLLRYDRLVRQQYRKTHF